MALITYPSETIPDLNYEYHTITIDSIGQDSANTFTCHLQDPLKNVVQARLLATNINTTAATKHCYISIDELDTIFNDRASNVYDGQSSMSMLRSSFARSIDRFTVNIRNQNGVPITPSSPVKNNFVIIRFVCRKPNL
jgi:hypothetical protein